MATIETSTRAAIPSVDRVLRRDETASLIAQYGPQAVTAAVREVLESLRSALERPSQPPGVGAPGIVDRVAARLRAEAQPSLRPVFNLTGTVLHTNLGRAPLPPEAIEAMVLAARGASNLEYDLGTGKRGERDDHVESQLRRLTGAQAATLVNNNAAAIMLVLNSLALRKEVPTSRGELIEIGGSFRLPDIMARSGCRLREVGTTNRTHLRDFEEAIGPRTGLVMKVCTSNYVIDGFAACVAQPALARLCRDRGVPLVVDLGSGSLVDLREFGLPHEPTIRETLNHGADIVTFSGDKLLGGPQAGVIVGRAESVALLKQHPLTRAVRPDKLTLAALAATLVHYLRGEAERKVPVWQMIATPTDALERRCQAHVATLGPVARMVETSSTVGGGSLPGETLPSRGIAIESPSPDRLAAALRAASTPVVARIEDDRVVLDLRTILPEQDPLLAAVFQEVLRPSAG